VPPSRPWVLAAAPDLFHRTGIEELRYDQHAEAMPLIGAIGREEIVTDVGALLAQLQEEKSAASRIAVIGFCFGGRAAFTAATELPGLGAAVVFYGPGIAAGPHAVVDRAGQLAAPLLMHVGSEDPTIPVEQIRAVEKALIDSERDYSLHVYQGAGHAFACNARPTTYRVLDADLAWERTFAFLDHAIPV
jgi:carboxymethylenebutenolidase